MGVCISVLILASGFIACVGTKSYLFAGQCAQWNELARLPYESSKSERPAAGVLCSIQTSSGTQRVSANQSAPFGTVRIS